MALQFSTGLRNSRLDAITAALGAAGVLQFFTGSVPANCAAADSGTLLAELALANPAAPAASGGVLTLSAIANDSSANATGTAGHFRLKLAGTTLAQGTVTLTGGGGDITLNSLDIVSGGIVAVTSFVLTEGGA